MTQDEILQMAYQAFDGVVFLEERENFVAFAKLVAGKEREAIEKMLEDALKAGRIINFTFASKAIRARGQA